MTPKDLIVAEIGLIECDGVAGCHRRRIGAKEFEERMNKDWIYLNQPSLRGLIAFIEAANVLIANDSGPMHVGPAVGTPTLGIFGPGEPEIWFPYTKPHQTFYSEVPCGHCGLDKCPWMTCMDRLTSVEAAKRVIELLSLPTVKNR